jgi:hypothetical protein
MDKLGGYFMNNEANSFLFVVQIKTAWNSWFVQWSHTVRGFRAYMHSDYESKTVKDVVVAYFKIMCPWLAGGDRTRETVCLRFIRNTGHSCVGFDFILWHIPRQRLAKHISECYAVNKNRRPLLDNGVGFQGITGLSGTAQTRIAVF